MYYFSFLYDNIFLVIVMEYTKSIIKKFRRKIWSKFVRAVKEYELINEE